MFGRSQDFALQKARQTVDERNHLRLWLTPLRFRGKEVFVGQISRDIGVRLTKKTIVTHKIDPDVDEARDYLAQDLIYSQRVAEIGFVPGVGAHTWDAPGRNYTGDPWFTDGLRLVVVLTGDPTSFEEIVWHEWSQGAGAQPSSTSR